MRVVHLKLLVASTLFGSYLVASKLALRDVSVFTAGFLRMASAAVFLAVFIALTRTRHAARPTSRDRFLMFSQAFIGVFLFSLLSLYGVRMTGAIEAGVILGMVPITVTLVAVVLLRERLAAVRCVGIVLAVAGAVGVNTLGGDAAAAGAGPHVVWGVLLLVGAVICEAVFVTFGRLLAAPPPPAVLSLTVAVLGGALLLVPAGIESAWGAELVAVPWRAWALLIYSGVAVNGIAAVLVYSSLATVDATVVASFLALTPVSGALLAVPLLNEDLRLHHIAGICLAVAGVYLAAREPTPEAEQDTVPEGRDGRMEHSGLCADN